MAENNKFEQTSYKGSFSIKNIVKGFSALLFFLASVVVLAGSIYLFINTGNKGRNIGVSAGKTAGKFLGSYEGITKGLPEGAKEGKKEGLSAKDTTVNIGNKVKAIGKLEILSASVVMHDSININEKYDTLIAVYGDIVFTVDLEKAEITVEDNNYDIILPSPEPTVIFDDKKTKQLVSSMKSNWSGSNEDGYTATKNSFDELKKNAEKTVSNYDELKDTALRSAEKQVKFLVKSITGEGVAVNVSFADKN